MAEHRPYRVMNPRTQAQLAEVKLISVASFLTVTLAVNWIVTQRAAAILGYSPLLGTPLFGRLYAPWQWIAWWARWHASMEFAPVWQVCVREAGLPLLLAAALAVAAIQIARSWLRDDIPDLHGSARWANRREVRWSGFLAPRKYLPRRLRRNLVRAGLLRPLKRREGIYLGAWRVHGKLHYLRDCGPGHVLLEAPTRAGKGVNNIVPTLLTWPHSTLVHDFKGELWQVTAGARKRMGQLCFNFDPAHLRGPGVKYNPLEEVRLRTPFEVADVQNLVEILLNPAGKGFGDDDHWVAAGKALLTGAILHTLYAEPNKTLRGLIGLLSDPASTIDDTMNRIMTAEHDPKGVMGWRNSRGEPSRTHQVVAESMREVLNKAEKDRSGVISEIVARLPLFRDPLITSATEYSEFRIDDLVNHERPASLYLTVPNIHRRRLRPLMRMMLNQIVYRFTEKLAYDNGRPVSAHRRPLLLVLDEFALFGKFEEFADSMSHIAGFGLRACLAVQSLNQIHGLYGPNQTIIDNCDTTVRFTPNSSRSAEEISRLAGQTTVRHEHSTQSGGGISVSQPEVGRPLMTPDEARRMSTDEVLIFARGQHPIRAPMLTYHEQPYFKRLSAIEPPVKSDRTITRTRAGGGQEAANAASSLDNVHPNAHPQDQRNETANPTTPTSPDAVDHQVRFLKFATEPQRSKSAPIE